MKDNIITPTQLPDIETDKVQLEVYECCCGYHMGIDHTFLEQVVVNEYYDFECPSCGSIMRIDV